MTVSIYFGREKHEPLVNASSQKLADKVSFAQCVSLKSTHVWCDWSRGPELQCRECEASACSPSVSHSFIQPWCRKHPQIAPRTLHFPQKVKGVTQWVAKCLSRVAMFVESRLPRLWDDKIWSQPRWSCRHPAAFVSSCLHICTPRTRTLASMRMLSWV